MANPSNGAFSDRSLSDRSAGTSSNPDDLYFVRVGRHLKIGRSRDVRERFRIISCHAPTKPELVGVLAGAGPTERVWHFAFRKIRSHREWFRICGPLKQTVDAALRGEDWTRTMGPEEWRDDIAAAFNDLRGEGDENAY
jgi:hypothetical protein